jgi:hypothetical protein
MPLSAGKSQLTLVRGRCAKRESNNYDRVAAKVWVMWLEFL